MATSESDQKGPFGMTIPFGLSPTMFYAASGGILLLLILIIYFVFFRSPSNPDDMPL